jgi:hypothetical protein
MAVLSDRANNLTEGHAFLYASRAAKEHRYCSLGGFFLLHHLIRCGASQHNRITFMAQEESNMKLRQTVLLAVLALSLASCASKIYGTVQLLDAKMQPVPITTENPQGTVVNMINTTTTLENASQAVDVDAEGKFVSIKNFIVPGMYKVEASRIGYMTETQSVEITKFGSKKVEFKLKMIPEGKQKSIEGSKSDEDKIVNPGEVNIQPPMM